MRFENPGPPLSEVEISECEILCGIRFPQELRDSYLSSNGGEPNPYVFENGLIDTIVSEFLPLISEVTGTSVQAYQMLVLGKSLIPANFFPFAIDGGGDYFLTDTSSRNGAVYFFRSDSDTINKLLDLKLGVAEFWQVLKPE